MRGEDKRIFMFKLLCPGLLLGNKKPRAMVFIHRVQPPQLEFEG